MLALRTLALLALATPALACQAPPSPFAVATGADPAVPVLVRLPQVALPAQLTVVRRDGVVLGSVSLE